MIKHYTSLTIHSACPLENTAYESYCFNETDGIASGKNSGCEFTATCKNLKQTLDMYASDENHTIIRTLEEHI
jgi:hypothetical protein